MRAAHDPDPPSATPGARPAPLRVEDVPGHPDWSALAEVAGVRHDLRYAGTNNFAARVAERGWLHAAMVRGGFQGIANEWWHFDHGDRERVRRTLARVL